MSETRMAPLRIGDTAWVRMYRGQEEVRVPATIIALQEGAGGYVVRGAQSPNAIWMTGESQLLPREAATARTCPACSGALALEECADCVGSGQCAGVDVEDRLWSCECPFCAGQGTYPLCGTCGWGGDECPSITETSG